MPPSLAFHFFSILSFHFNVAIANPEGRSENDEFVLGINLDFGIGALGIPRLIGERGGSIESSIF